ncbi:MAG: hypothetical protein FWD57_14785, partial [Polyangiaceae bacterium]|nr:hypothetical protein [Polyangiaceae bacterium]
DRRARDVSLLIDGVTGLLSLVSTVILVMAGANVAYTFRALTLERHAEIALYRAVGASRRDIFLWQVVLALVVGVVYSLFGLVLGLVGMVGVDWIGIHLVPEFPFKPDSFFVVPLWLVFAVVGFGGGVAVLGAARGRGTTS